MHRWKAEIQATDMHKVPGPGRGRGGIKKKRLDPKNEKPGSQGPMVPHVPYSSLLQADDICEESRVPYSISPCPPLLVNTA